MADMTLCCAKNCKDKEKCFRYTNLHNASQYQSYHDPSMNKEQDRFTCDSFWATKEFMKEENKLKKEGLGNEKIVRG